MKRRLIYIKSIFLNEYEATYLYLRKLSILNVWQKLKRTLSIMLFCNRKYYLIWWPPSLTNLFTFKFKCWILQVSWICTIWVMCRRWNLCWFWIDLMRVRLTIIFNRINHTYGGISLPRVYFSIDYVLCKINMSTCNLTMFTCKTTAIK